MKFDLKFKHERLNFIQAVYGGLDEDASLLAVENTASRLDQLFEEIEEKAKDNPEFNESKVLELCCERAKSIEELVIFIHKVASESASEKHPFLEILKRFPRKEDDSE